MKAPRIIAVHLLNDLSGSPFVLSQALEVFQGQGHEVHLFTSTPGGNGFLSGLRGVSNHQVFYRRGNNKIAVLWYFLINQFTLFLKLLIFARRGDLVYINSILPFGAAVAARIRNCPVLYHIHEVSIQPRLLNLFLLWVVKSTASHCNYVSEYTRQHTPVPVKAKVIYNALPAGFINNSLLAEIKKKQPFTVLMLCSLRKYKGIAAFISSATALPALQFELVLNATTEEIDHYFIDQLIPPNCKLYPAQTDVHPFYCRASVVVNLSFSDQWIETFGMTILQAMYYKKPVIVPPVGGVTELVLDGINGFYINSRHVDQVTAALQKLSVNKALYEAMSNASFNLAKKFTVSAFSSGILDSIHSIYQPEINERVLHGGIKTIKNELT